jgi:hypothetical protein
MCNAPEDKPFIHKVKCTFKLCVDDIINKILQRKLSSEDCTFKSVYKHYISKHLLMSSLKMDDFNSVIYFFTKMQRSFCTKGFAYKGNTVSYSMLDFQLKLKNKSLQSYPSLDLFRFLFHIWKCKAAIKYCLFLLTWDSVPVCVCEIICVTTLAGGWDICVTSLESVHGHGRS